MLLHQVAVDPVDQIKTPICSATKKTIQTSTLSVKHCTNWKEIYHSLFQWCWEITMSTTPAQALLAPCVVTECPIIKNISWIRKLVTVLAQSMHVLMAGHLKKEGMFMNISINTAWSQMSLWVVGLWTCMPNVAAQREKMSCRWLACDDSGHIHCGKGRKDSYYLNINNTQRRSHFLLLLWSCLMHVLI